MTLAELHLARHAFLAMLAMVALLFVWWSGSSRFRG
jgi:hypothetical protein